MRHFTLMGIALAITLAASPAAAQQSAQDQSQAYVPPPTTEPPPPFPHYPARAPREHDPNYRRPTHVTHKSQSHRQAATHRRATAHHKTTAHHKAKTHRAAARQYFSKKTIRQCHRLSYEQIMRNGNCRTMMKQDLEATARKHEARRGKSTRHRSSAHHHRKASRHRG